MGSLQLVGFVGPSVNWWALLPQIILLGAALAVLLVLSLIHISEPTRLMRIGYSVV